MSGLVCILLSIIPPLALLAWKMFAAERWTARRVIGEPDVPALRDFYRLDPAYRYLCLDDQRRLFYRWRGGIPTRCPACRYDRRGSNSTACPECGWHPYIPIFDKM